MLPCAALPRAKSGKLSALLENHVETAHLYHECSERHEALAAVVRTMQQHAQGDAPQPQGAAPGAPGDIEEEDDDGGMRQAGAWWSDDGAPSRSDIGLHIGDEMRLFVPEAGPLHEGEG